MRTTDVLLSPAMARARAEGRKTVTRRIVKHQPDVSPLVACVYKSRRNQCPYGNPENQIRWLTTWAAPYYYDRNRPVEVSATRPLWSYHLSDTKPEEFGKLRPGRFLPGHLRYKMPVDEVVSVRIERLHDITEDDAIKEGVKAPTCEKCGYTLWDCKIQMDHNLCGEPTPSSAIPVFKSLWESINGKGSWAANPWVWVLEFKPIQP